MSFVCLKRGVRIKRAEFRENVRAFLRGKENCPYEAGVCKARSDYSLWQARFGVKLGTKSLHDFCFLRLYWRRTHSWVFRSMPWTQVNPSSFNNYLKTLSNGPTERTNTAWSLLQYWAKWQKFLSYRYTAGWNKVNEHTDSNIPISLISKCCR